MTCLWKKGSVFGKLLESVFGKLLESCTRAIKGLLVWRGKNFFFHLSHSTQRDRILRSFRGTPYCLSFFITRKRGMDSFNIFSPPTLAVGHWRLKLGRQFTGDWEKVYIETSKLRELEPTFFVKYSWWCFMITFCGFELKKASFAGKTQSMNSKSSDWRSGLRSGLRTRF